MIILIKIEGRSTEVTINGHSTIHRTSFIKKLSLSDLIEYVKTRI